MKKFKLEDIDRAAARVKTRQAARKTAAVKLAFIEYIAKKAQETAPSKPTSNRSAGGNFNAVGTANPLAFYTALAQAAAQAATSGNVLKGKLVRPI